MATPFPYPVAAAQFPLQHPHPHPYPYPYPCVYPYPIATAAGSAATPVATYGFVPYHPHHQPMQMPMQMQMRLPLPPIPVPVPAPVPVSSAKRSLEPEEEAQEKRVRFEAAEENAQAAALLVRLSKSTTRTRSIDLPDMEEINMEMQVRNASIKYRTARKEGCECNSHPDPCRKCLLATGVEDLKYVLRNTTTGNNVFESWLDLQCFCVESPQREMLDIVAEIMENHPTSRDGVRRFANYAVKLVGQPLATMNLDIWFIEKINLGACQITEAINELLMEEDKAKAEKEGHAYSGVKHALGSHLQPEACARSILAYFFLNRRSTPRPTKQRKPKHHVDQRDTTLYQRYREKVTLKRDWNIHQMLVKFKQMPWLA